MVRLTAWPLAALTAACIVAFGCATSVTPPFGEGGGGEGGDDDGQGGAKPGCQVDCSIQMTDQCLVSVCNEQKHACEIVPTPGGEACDDGLFCTVGEVCQGGVCGGGLDNTCGLADDHCSSITCDEAQKSCSTVPSPDGVPCAIDNLCVVNATCKSGLCSGEQKDCFFAPVPDICHISMCNPETGKCEPTPGNNGTTCPDDGDPCMLKKTCSNGVCAGGVPKDCSGIGTSCSLGVCEPSTGECVIQPLAPGDMCSEATDLCNVGFCDANGVCAPTPANEGVACDDGISCTMGEVCSAGVCKPPVSGNYIVYFQDTFSSNAANWKLGTEWQIGPAKASFCSQDNDDPGMDHTPSADNGVAGVVIGGCASTSAVHAMYYLESPPINADVMGSVHFEFWRVLNSDYAPYMNNIVEVFDGATWHTLFESGEDPVTDFAWTKQSYDVTAYKNPAMKVRFGFDIQDSFGVFTESSWNVDDVVIASAPCP